MIRTVVTRLFSVTLLVCISGSAGASAAEPVVSVLVGGLLKPEGGTFDPDRSPLDSPFGVGLDRAGNLYAVELGGGRVHELSPDGKLTTLAGRHKATGYRGDGGPAGEALFNGMHNLAVTPEGDLYIADSWNHCVRKIDGRTGVISTFAGTGKAGFRGDGGPADRASFDYLMCVTLSPSGDKLYLTDLRNRRVRAIDMKTRVVTTVAGDGRRGVPRDGAPAAKSPLVDPRAAAPDSKGNVYILERAGHALRVVTPDGRIRTVAGTGKPGDKDGPAREAMLNSPKHLCVDDRDRVYIADDLNAKIRRYDPESQTLTTVLGGGTGAPPVRLSHPHGVWFHGGVLYVVDTGHNRILTVR
ncbi:MAG TPA: hypothetical protein VIL46_05895 [Gemmataceae bacterium]